MTDFKIVLNKENPSFMTSKLMGVLSAVITTTNQKTSILIESELGYIIYSDEVVGTKIAGPRLLTHTYPLYGVEAPSHDRFKIDESLIITTIGATEDVEIILRFL